MVYGMGYVFSGSTDRTDLFLPIDIPGKHKKMSNSNSWKRCECCLVTEVYKTLKDSKDSQKRKFILRGRGQRQMSYYIFATPL